MLEFLENRRMLSVTPIWSLSLINTDTNKPVPGYQTLHSGVTLDLAVLPQHLDEDVSPVNDIRHSVLLRRRRRRTFR